MSVGDLSQLRGGAIGHLTPFETPLPASLGLTGNIHAVTSIKP
jgi:hypothetical protein